MRHDPRDRLIRALAAQLGAERETRAAVAHVIANGMIDSEVLLALLEDPVPAVSQEDLDRANRVAALVEGSGGGARAHPSLNLHERPGLDAPWKS